MSVIRSTKIKNISVNISENLTGTFQLQTEYKSKIRTPKDEQDRTMLLNIEMEIKTPDSDEVQIAVDANIIFEFENKPGDYAKIAEKECIPMAQKDLLNRVDEVLNIMGYMKLQLAEKMK